MKTISNIKIVVRRITDSSIVYNEKTNGREFYKLVVDEEINELGNALRHKHNFFEIKNPFAWEDIGEFTPYSFECFTLQEMIELRDKDPSFYNFIISKINYNDYHEDFTTLSIPKNCEKRKSLSFYIFDQLNKDVEIIEGEISFIMQITHKYGIEIPTNLQVKFLGIVRGAKEYQEKYESNFNKLEKKNIRCLSEEKFETLQKFHPCLFLEILQKLETTEQKRPRNIATLLNNLRFTYFDYSNHSYLHHSIPYLAQIKEEDRDFFIFSVSKINYNLACYISDKF